MTNAPAETPAPPPSRPVHRPPPPPGDRRLARAHDRRRGRERPAVLALVPELRGARAARPTRAASARSPRSATGARAPNVVVFHTRRRCGAEPRHPGGHAARGGGRARRPHELVLLDREPDVPLARPAHGVPGRVPARRGAPRPRQQRRSDPRGRARPASRPGSASTSPAATRSTRRASTAPAAASSVLVEARDRRGRRAGRPAVRVRDAARGADAARRRRRRDLQHLHARVGADLRHRRLDHRPVPDRARRARHRDRLRAADDHALPRGDPRARATSRRRSSRR